MRPKALELHRTCILPRQQDVIRLQLWVAIIEPDLASVQGVHCYRASDKEIRDKKHLTEARAMIERRMEKFKECEKDLKVKDFSKVGLEKGAKLDPKQAAIDERREWLRSCVDRIDTVVCDLLVIDQPVAASGGVKG